MREEGEVLGAGAAAGEAVYAGCGGGGGGTALGVDGRQVVEPGGFGRARGRDHLLVGSVLVGEVGLRVEVVGTGAEVGELDSVFGDGDVTVCRVPELASSLYVRLPLFCKMFRDILGKTNIHPSAFNENSTEPVLVCAEGALSER